MISGVLAGSYRRRYRRARPLAGGLVAAVLVQLERRQRAALAMLVHRLALLLVIYLSPLNPAILKPDFDLGLGETKSVGEVEPLRADHVLLPREFALETLELLGGEDGPHPLGLSAAPVAAAASALGVTGARGAALRRHLLTYESVG